MRKRILLIMIICLSMLTISSRRHFTGYNRSVLYLGLSSPDKKHMEEINKINNLFLKDIREVLLPSVILTDLSIPYLYSRNTDLPSIAKTRRVRWIIHGTAEAERDKTAGISMRLYDAVEKKNVEKVSLCNSSPQGTAVKGKMQYIYSIIAEANNFFSPYPKKKKSSPSPRRIAVIDFSVSGWTGGDFTKTTAMIRQIISSRREWALTSVSGREMTFVNMKSRAHNSDRRLRAIGMALNACWIINGGIRIKPGEDSMRCSLNLFNSKKNRMAGSLNFSAPDYTSMNSAIRRRLESLMLVLSAGDNYSLHRFSDFGTVVPGFIPLNNDGPPKKNGGQAGATFDGSSLLMSENGCITRFGPDGSVVQKVKARGAGIGRLRVSGCIQTDAGGRLYVMDNASRKIVIFSMEGNFISEFFYSAGNPANFIATPDGYIHIPDFGKRSVQVYTREGSHIRDVHFKDNIPLALCSCGGNPVVITDRKGFYRINFLTSQGSFVRAMQTGISGELLSLDSCGMDDKKNLYGSDISRNLIFCLDSSGRIAWIKNGSAGKKKPPSVYPFCVSVDREGDRLAVLDIKNRRIINFRRITAESKSPATVSR